MDILVIPIASVAFSLGGIMMQMQEELVAFVPVLLLLVRRLGFTPVVAVAMSLGAAAIGAAFSPVNPFQVVIAQKVSQLPPGPGLEFRLGFLLLALGIWILGTMWYAGRTRVPPEPSAGAGQAPQTPGPDGPGCPSSQPSQSYIYGAQRLGWEFDSSRHCFLWWGCSAGLLGRLGFSGTAEAFGEGFKSMAVASLLIGFARAIYVVLDEGQIVDTVVHGMFRPIAGLPPTLSALGMMVVQGAIHLPVPSTSSQAVLTLPLLVPLSDLIGLARQVTVLAYQYGAGLCEIITPTNGALMAMLAAAGVRYEDWIRFVIPLWALLMLLSPLLP